MSFEAVVGLDAAQANAAYHLCARDGRLLGRGSAATTLEGWEQLTAELGRHNLQWSQVCVAVEATGQRHLPWSEAATAAGAQVLALNPLIAKRTTPVGNAVRDYKSDPIDAAGLTETALRCAAALTRFTYRSEPERFGLRKLLSVRETVRTSLTNLRKSAGDLADLVFPELGSVKLTLARQEALLTRAPSAAAIAALPLPELQTLVGDKALAVQTLARRSFAPPKLTAVLAPAVQGLLATVAAVQAQLQALDRQVAVQARKALDDERVQRARQLPGFGPKVTPVILACIPDELLDPHRSRRQQANKLQALFGCEPRLRTSGKWTGKIKISKRGIRPARTALYQAAFCALIHDSSLLAYYRRLRSRGKHHKTALVDVMRRLLRRLVAVLLAPSSPCST